MSNDRNYETCEVTSAEVVQIRRSVERRRWIFEDDAVVDPWSYLAKVGLGTIRLSQVEYRILNFLAARPYHAYSRRSIAKAVSTDLHPVTEETLGRYIRSLRDQLGFYSNYIQKVPYIGYRFKA